MLYSVDFRPITPPKYHFGLKQNVTIEFVKLQIMS